MIKLNQNSRKSAAPALKQCRTEPKCESAHSWANLPRNSPTQILPLNTEWEWDMVSKCMGNCPIHLVNSYGIFVAKYIIPIHSH